MAEKIDPPDWIYPGAKVLLVADYGAVVSRSIVKQINKISFSLVKRDLRISLESLTCLTGPTWSGTHYEVVDPDSERGLVLWRNEERRRIKLRAKDDVDAWREGDPEDLDKIDAAIVALQKWRAAAAVPAEQVPGEKTWMNKS